MSLFTNLTSGATREPEGRAGGARPAVSAAIAEGARRGGGSFEYLTAVARQESGLDPRAKARTSSATGLFQFVADTWLRLVREEGPALGLAAEAAAVTRDARGRPVVADPAKRVQVLALREDPETSAAMAARLTARNRASLTVGLGREPDAGELYAAHVLGAGAAIRFLKARDDMPKALAADLLPAAAEANPALFRDGAGRPASLNALHAKLVAGFAATGTRVAEASAPAPAPRTPVPVDFWGGRAATRAGRLELFTDAVPA